MTIYHYCAKYETGPGAMRYFDGVLTTGLKIDSLERYVELKKAISPEHADRLVILSLTVLHPKG